MSDEARTTIQFVIAGCDDETYIEVEATPDEAAFLDQIIELSRERSNYQCQPKILLRGDMDRDEDWDDWDDSDN